MRARTKRPNDARSTGLKAGVGRQAFVETEGDEQTVPTAMGNDPYSAILEELYRKREEIEAAIAAIKQIAQPGQISVATRGEVPSDDAADEAGGPARSAPISEALLSAMHGLGGSASNAQIKSALMRSGYRFRGDPTVSVAQCLVRLAKVNKVEKLERGMWRIVS